MGGVLVMRAFVPSLLVLGLASLVTITSSERVEPRPVLLEPMLPNVNMTIVRHQAGECAVGASCGAAAAWILRRLQSTATTLAVLGSMGTLAALHLHWLSIEQVRAVAFAVSRLFYDRVAALIRCADFDGDGELTLDVRRCDPVATSYAAAYAAAHHAAASMLPCHKHSHV